MRFAVLASGAGTTLQALLDAYARGDLRAEPALVISNHAAAGAMERAKAAGVACAHLGGRTHPELEALDRAILQALRDHRINVVLLTGYLKKIGPLVLSAFHGRILNTHPALLPRYGGQGMYGARVHEAVLANSEVESGVSIHHVTAEYDEGPLLHQTRVPVLAGDTVDTLTARVQAAERIALVSVLNALAAGESVRPSLAAQIKQSAKLKGQFTLRSGKVSDTYFDKYQFEAQPELLLAIAKELAKLIPPDTQVLAGLEMGGIPVVTMLSQATGLPAAFIRKQPKAYGTCRYAEGAALTGKQFVLIEDVVSSGGAIIDALQMLKADGLFPVAALCVIDRETGGVEALAEVGLSLKALFTFSEVDSA